MEQNRIKVFQNPVIVDHVLDMWLPRASPQNMKNIRLVCQAWHRKSLPWWRKKAVLSVHWPDTYPIHWYSFSPETEEQLRRMHPGELSSRMLHPLAMTVPCPYLLQELPFEEYAFHNCRITPLHLIENENNILRWTESQFWVPVGQIVTHLSLVNAHFCAVGGVENPASDADVLRFFHEYMPNLTSLTLQSVSNGQRIGVFLDGMGSDEMSLPKIRSITISDSFGVPLKYFSNLEHLKFTKSSHLLKMDQTGNHNLCPKLKSLDMLDCNAFTSPESEPIVTIPKICFPALTHLKVHIDPVLDNNFFERTGRPGFLHQFLKKHSDKLESLHIFHSVGVLPSGPRLFKNCYPNLIELRLWGFVVKNLKFLKQAPNLQILHVDTHAIEKREKARQYEWWSELILETQENLVKAAVITGLQMQHLIYLHLDQTLTVESIYLFGMWMPRLKTFKSILNSDTFAVVCETWSNLEYLHCLFGSRIFDKDICPDIRELNKGLYGLRCLPASDTTLFVTIAN